jgi:hypothetical protein
MALDRFKENETEANRVRKLNALIDALGLAEGATLSPDVLPVATASTLGAVRDGNGVTIAPTGVISVP